jgi:3-oxoacyl-[acyl-carrier-protein] synthase-3
MSRPPLFEPGSTSAQVQALIGARRAVAFDLTAACSGFVLALVTGAQFIRTGAAKQVLVVGADALSRYVDWRDRCASTLCRSLTHVFPAALGTAK